MGAAEDARDDGMERAEKNASEVWKVEAEAAINYCATYNRYFTTDHIWELLEGWKVPPPHEPRALGPLMQKAVKHQIIKPVGVSNSKMVRAHARPKTTYESRICK
jgi:diketogulonate reductase-like aldo/keto reductase